MWRETTKHDRNATIWRQELDTFVPRRVLDFHVHLFDKATLPAGQTFSAAGHPIAGYEFEDLDQDLAQMYPDRETAAVCFGLPDTSYDMARNNQYVADGCDGARFFPFRLIDPAEDVEELRRDILAGGFVGLKPYLEYVRKEDANSVEIDEMLPAGVMEVADELGLIVTLHIPRKARLADPLNQEQLVGLCSRYPRTKIVLAHVGRAYFLRNVLGNLDRLKDLPNLYYDLAMVMNVDVLEYVFKTVAPERLLYGTDIPIALAPGHSVEINHQYTYVTPVPWELSISDDHGKLVFTSFVYEELRAIKKAVERLGYSQGFVDGLFYDNGMRLLSSSRRT